MLLEIFDSIIKELYWEGWYYTIVHHKEALDDNTGCRTSRGASEYLLWLGDGQT